MTSHKVRELRRVRRLMGHANVFFMVSKIGKLGTDVCALGKALTCCELVRNVAVERHRHEVWCTSLTGKGGGVNVDASCGGVIMVDGDQDLMALEMRPRMHHPCDALPFDLMAAS